MVAARLSTHPEELCGLCALCGPGVRPALRRRSLELSSRVHTKFTMNTKSTKAWEFHHPQGPHSPANRINPESIIDLPRRTPYHKPRLIRLLKYGRCAFDKGRHGGNGRCPRPCARSPPPHP